MSAPSECGFVSPLASQLAQFLTLKHAMGYRYREEGRVLHDLDRFLSTRLSAADPLVTPAVVYEYIARRGTESDTTRAHLDDARVVVPDRRSLRIVRQTFVPRVLSRDEGSRFLQACTQLPPGQGSPIRAAVLGTALRLLYLAGLRAGELLRLTQADLDLETGALRIRHSKFNKSRLVPLAPDLIQRIVQCRVAAAERFGPCRPETPLFPSPRGARYSITALRGAFHDALRIAGIKRTTDCRIRLHDLRHSFAGLRLLLWCEQNVDLGAKLPLLAAYLGHVGLASSQRYLQLTRDLMGEITRRHQARFGYLIREESR
jgi:integrase/recombinase XerD